MPIDIVATLQPKNNAGFAVVNISDVRGGYLSVATSGIRDLIPSGLRATGMQVHLQNSNLCYRLSGGISNDNWILDLPIVASSYFSGSFNPTGAWTFSHNLGFYPSITVYDLNNNQILVRIKHNSINGATLYFNSLTSGYVYCS